MNFDQIRLNLQLCKNNLAKLQILQKNPEYMFNNSLQGHITTAVDVITILRKCLFLVIFDKNWFIDFSGDVPSRYLYF